MGNKWWLPDEFKGLDAIQDPEKRKEAARKMLADKYRIAPGTKPTSFIAQYIKDGWQGKVSFVGILLPGFILGKLLSLIAENVPTLEWPIAIFGLACTVWFTVSLWRCAFNGMSRRWVGWMLRFIFIIFPFTAPLIILVLILMQTVPITVECNQYKKTYEDAVAAKADPKNIEQAKSVFDACIIRKEECLNDLDKCGQKSIP